MDDKAINIVARVASMYLEYGIKGVTMDDVAHKLAISKKTLYQHFKDKKDLVWAVLAYHDSKKNIDFSILDERNTNAINELFYYYEIQVEMIKNHKPAFVHDLRKYYPDIYLHFQKIKHKRILESVKNNLKKGKKEGLYRNDLNEDIISRLNLMRIEGIMNSDIFSVEELVSTNLFDEIFRYHLFGIVSDKGRKILDQKFNNILNQ
ncbi:MAG: TetR/AcrR family transcriptional regulator [Bacteroidetes bacterium]|nr:TetR/AcrR family transcriptional regulator [Bacteroidota bacterium]MBL6943248.1 TetR/AcrR family transcriptional regulator [Bacteroidales bacterium]